MLPDDKVQGIKAMAGQSGASVNAAIPYVPPLANTFASTNVSTIPLVPNTGKSDAEIVFGKYQINKNLVAIHYKHLPFYQMCQAVWLI